MWNRCKTPISFSPLTGVTFLHRTTFREDELEEETMRLRVPKTEIIGQVGYQISEGSQGQLFSFQIRWGKGAPSSKFSTHVMREKVKKQPPSRN